MKYATIGLALLTTPTLALDVPTTETTEVKLVTSTHMAYIKNNSLYYLDLRDPTEVLVASDIVSASTIPGGLSFSNISGDMYTLDLVSGSVYTLFDSNISYIINGTEVILPSLDSDKDGVGDELDNCPSVPNPNQNNIDQDIFGDACDSDMDGDGYSNAEEKEAGTKPWSPSSHPVSNIDIDGDGYIDLEDNCPSTHNPTQWDNDGDGIGNSCDSDADGDDYSNEEELLAKSDPWTDTSTPLNINGYIPPTPCGNKT